MATTQPALNDPDKLGLLIQCRQKMDKLKMDDLKSFVLSITDILSIYQLKKILFIGLNSIKKELRYNQLFEMKSSINKIIEKEKKLKQKLNKNPPSTMKKALIPSIPKNASFSEIIPFDIISNNICKYLKMSTITKLARCDRKLSIICHTPISITNLMHRYDSYKYYSSNTEFVIDGKYKWNDLSIHRIKNIEKLSIKMDDCIEEKLNIFNKVKYLSFYDYCTEENDCSYNIDLNDMKILPSLQTISFSDFEDLPFILSFLQKYKNNSNDSSSNNKLFYNDIIYKIESISFINCQFGVIPNYGDISEEYEFELQREYKNMIHLILPITSNNLEILKLENSYFDTTIHPETNDTNHEFKNIRRIKLSLSNLKGFVYSSPPITINHRYENNLFSDISNNILTHLRSFKKLKSLHIHCDDEELILLSLSNTRIKELCISLHVNDYGNLELTQINNNMQNNLNKLCLVINLSNNGDDDSFLLGFIPFIKGILINCRKLKLLQIVAIIKDNENDDSDDSNKCNKCLDILYKFISKIIDSFQRLTNHHKHSELFASKPFIFKFHIKSCHYYFGSKCSMKKGLSMNKLGNIIQNMITNYLLSYPMGQIQVKFTWNIEDWLMISNKIGYPLKGLNGIFDVDTKNNGIISHLKCNNDMNISYCCNERDYRQYVVSARKKNIKINNHIQYDKQWLVDCQYCCNTPWI